MKIKQLFKSLNPYTQIVELKKSLKIAYEGLLRPYNPYNFNYGNNLGYPSTYLGYKELYDLAYNSDILSIVHRAVRSEMFRNGFDLVPGKVTDEGNTQSEQEVEPTGTSPEEPKSIDEIRKGILDFLETINQNDQNLIEVMNELEDDLSIVDNFFCLLNFAYDIDDSSGEIVNSELTEVLRINPTFMGLVINQKDMLGFDDEHNELFVCTEHRENLLTNSDTCTICGKKAYRACYFHQWGDKKIFYYKHEIIHQSKYRPSKRGGYPPMFTLSVKTETLYFMDTYMKALYDKRRPPRSGLFFGTTNVDSLQKAIEQARQKAREDPHFPMVMGIENIKSSKSFVEFVDFMKSLQDLQFVDVRDEMRRVIGSFYGVSPIFQNDISSAGGLNNEGLQITVTNRAIQVGHELYNKHLLPKILEALKVQGWSLFLKPSEEQDEMAKLERQELSISNGERAVKLGLEAEYDEDQGEVVIHSGTLTEPVDTGFPPYSSQDADSDLSPPQEDSDMQGEPLSASFSLDDKALIEKAKSRLPFTNLSKRIKAEIDKFVKTYKRKPSTKQLKSVMRKLNSKLREELMQSNTTLFRRTYMKEMGAIEKQIGMNLSFTGADQNAINVLASQPVLSKAYQGIADQLSSKINEVISANIKSPDGLSLQKIQSEIQDAVHVSDFRAETIARTETSKVASAARINQYRKEEDFGSALFKHIGPTDRRTTQTSKRIKDMTKNGVSWDQYVDIVTKESRRDFPTWNVNPNFPVAFWNTRHTFTRIN